MTSISNSFFRILTCLESLELVNIFPNKEIFARVESQTTPTYGKYSERSGFISIESAIVLYNSESSDVNVLLVS